MAFVRKFLFAQVLLNFCRWSQEAMIEVPESKWNISAVFIDHSEGDEFEYNSEAPYRYKSVEFIESKFERIPTSILFKFPAIGKLDLTNCGIKSINSEDFLKLSPCEDLKLNDNPVYNLKGDVFTHLPNLRKLSLANMSLSSLNETTFLKQAELAILNLQNNYIKTITSKLLEPLKNLEWINLRYNNIKSLEYGVFKFNHNLRTIDCAFNDLSYFGDKIFTNTTLNYLHTLILHNNDLTFLDVPKCNTLLANNNRYLALFELKNPIKYVNLAQCALKILPNIVYSEVISLDVRNNPIKNILHPLENATKLENLYLSSTVIKELPDFAFQGLKSLKQLYLANMGLRIETIRNEKLFADLQNLEVLDLSENLFNDIKFSYFRYSPKLDKIYLGTLNRKF